MLKQKGNTILKTDKQNHFLPITASYHQTAEPLYIHLCSLNDHLLFSIKPLDLSSEKIPQSFHIHHPADGCAKQNIRTEQRGRDLKPMEAWRLFCSGFTKASEALKGFTYFSRKKELQPRDQREAFQALLCIPCIHEVRGICQEILQEQGHLYEHHC